MEHHIFCLLLPPAGKTIACIFFFFFLSFFFLFFSFLTKEINGQVPGGGWVREKQSILEGDRVRQFPLFEILSLLIFLNEEMEVVILKTCLYLADSYF